MARRSDLESICLIGSGPIVIGQAAEFDYAGCQALKVLREDGYRTIVVNSNPATIMTDPGFADRTYLEPLDLEGVAGVLRRERPDAVLPTMGGGTALNLARELEESGTLRELGIELIGARIDAIQRAEDRELFKQTVEGCGLRVPTSRIVTSVDDLGRVALPAVVRPAFTLGGHGGGFAETHEQLVRQVERGLAESPISQVLVEESVRGWDEFELEVVRDRADNVVIVCSIENLDPMGVHTGDSITVAPQMTLSDEAYQELRDAAIAVIRQVGVDTGGSNIQFARSRETGEVRVIELNPRVSRSSALASKATGYPIAKVAAKLAVGYTLDEIPNDLTGTTPASFEPTLDYVVVKIPRFAFEKFPGADRTLGTQMKAVGETMGIGRTFLEAFVKAKRGLEGEQPDGVVIQFGGQTPLKLARAIEAAGFRILGTPFDAVDLAEDRERFGKLLSELGVRCPEWGIARSGIEAAAIAHRIGYPVLVRPSYVVGGRAMRVCHRANQVVDAFHGVQGPTLVDRFLERAVEIDVDALCDGRDTYVAAIMQHVEEAGVHSGDSACVLPAQSLGAAASAEISSIVKRLGPALGVVGLLNVQLAVVDDDEVFVLEVNPRASRTVPFASKSIGVNLVAAACRLAAGPS